jgi:16S rRNA processing protein RimM
MENKDLISIGKITKPQGIRGEFRLRLSLIPLELFSILEEIYIQYPQGKMESFSIEKSRIQKNFIVVKLEGIDTRNQSEELRGCLVYIPEEDLPALSDGEFYDFELIGLSVFTNKEIWIGELEEVLHLPANDVYVVRNEDGKEHWIPAIDDVILEIDFVEEKMIIFPMEGLLD